jgi:cell division protein FtsL
MTSKGESFNLVMIMLDDLRRHLFSLLLFFLVIGSALAVILTAHNNRQLSIVQENLLQERDQLDVEWRHLVIEQSALTEHNRIEALVKEQLDMHRPLDSEEVVVRVK